MVRDSNNNIQCSPVFLRTSKVQDRYSFHPLYYKVYNSSCSQVGHDLIDRVKSSPEQIKIIASIYKHILCDDGSAACSDIGASIQ